MEPVEIHLTVNGAPVELNQFAGRVLGNVVLGIVNSLRLQGEPELIELKVTATKSPHTT